MSTLSNTICYFPLKIWNITNNFENVKVETDLDNLIRIQKSGLSFIPIKTLNDTNSAILHYNSDQFPITVYYNLSDNILKIKVELIGDFSIIKNVS